MKRSSIWLCAAVLLCCTGCAKTESTISSSEQDLSIIFPTTETDTEPTTETGPETTEPPTDAPTEAPTETEPPTVEMTETAAETVPTETELTPSSSGAQDAALTGTWIYGSDDQIQMEFRQNGTLLCWSNCTDLVRIRNGIVETNFDEQQSYPLTISENRVYAHDGDAFILDMTAEPGTDAASLQGVYTMNPCLVYDTVTGREGVKMLVRLTGDTLYFGFASQYRADGTTLTVMDEEGSFSLQYAFEDGNLQVTDDEGNTDTLIRIDGQKTA